MIKKLAVLLVIIPSLAFAVAPDAPTNVATDLTPNWVEDETFPTWVYAPNYGSWNMEIMFGNMSTSTAYWYDAPGEEVGHANIQACSDGPEGSYKVYCAVAASEMWPQLIEHDLQTGISRLILDAYGKEEGDSTEAAGGYPFYNPYDDTVYLMGKGFCIRKLADDGDGTHSVSIVAGNCSTDGGTDGNGTAARFGSIVGATADGAGNLWVWDKNRTNTLRKIDVNGEVTTITDAVRDDGSSTILCLLNEYRPVLLSPGRDSSSIHIANSDSCAYGWNVQRMNTSTHAMTRVLGTNPQNDPYDRYGGKNSDGPALTHVYQQFSGIGGYYSNFYDMIMVHGNDNTTMQLYDYRTDWVHTKGRLLRPWMSLGSYTDEDFYDGPIPLEDRAFNVGTPLSPYIKGVDRYGGAYYGFSGNTKVAIRIYNSALGGLALGDFQ